MIAEVTSTAAPGEVWPLLAQPRQWSRWAPHLRGAIALGSPEVQVGRRGWVIVGVLLPVPVRITALSPGRFWDWQTGPVRFRHAVEPHPDGSLIRFELHAPAPLEAGLALTYGPVMRLVARRLAAVSARPH